MPDVTASKAKPHHRGFPCLSRRPIPTAIRARSAVVLMLIAALAAATIWRPRPLLLWNASPSSRVGLYLLAGPGTPRVGDVMVAWAPPAARRLAAARSYLPSNVPIVKRVAAIGGDRVCARKDRILVDGRVAALRRRHDPSGRIMPWWSGCVRLARGQLFLLSSAGPLAFDGRYFGPTRQTELVGKARLLWARPATRANG